MKHTVYYFTFLTTLNCSIFNGFQDIKVWKNIFGFWSVIALDQNERRQCFENHPLKLETKKIFRIVKGIQKCNKIQGCSILNKQVGSVKFSNFLMCIYS